VTASREQEWVVLEVVLGGKGGPSEESQADATSAPLLAREEEKLAKLKPSFCSPPLCSSPQSFPVPCSAAENANQL